MYQPPHPQPLPPYPVGGQAGVAPHEMMAPDNVQYMNHGPFGGRIVAAVSPRVLVGDPVQRPPIPQQILQNVRGESGGHLLLKTDSGQYQLLRVGQGPVAAHNEQARLSAAAGIPPPPLGQSTVNILPMSVIESQQENFTTEQQLMNDNLRLMASSLPPPEPVAPPPVSVPSAPPQSPRFAASLGTQTMIPTPSFHVQAPTQMRPVNTRETARSVLVYILDLSKMQSKTVEENIRNLVQTLVLGNVEPIVFCDFLQHLLGTALEPNLVELLQDTMPLLRKAMAMGEISISGIIPPSFNVVYTPAALVQPSTQYNMPFNVPMPLMRIQSIEANLLGYCKMLNIAAQPDDGHFYHHLIGYIHERPPITYQQGPGGSGVGMSHGRLPTKPTGSGKSMTINKQASMLRAQPTPSTSIAPGKSLFKERERSLAFQNPFSDDKMAGDDDINDVAAMGGVNLQEETQRILGNTDMIGSQIRSCKDEYLVPSAGLQARIRNQCLARGLEEPPLEVAQLMSHALQERMKTILERLTCNTLHRQDTDCKTDSRYEVSQDVKGQLKFLEDLDRVEKKRREDSERELLLRAAKSRSKTEDPEQVKLKAKAKEMQRAEMEEMRQREANLTALQAIGPRKRPRLDASDATPTTQQQPQMGPSGAGRLRARLRRITLRDMLHLLENDRAYARSAILYKAYLKA